MKRPSKGGRRRSMDEQTQSMPGIRPGPGAPTGERRSSIAKVSHTLSVDLARRLEEFAFFQRVSESAVIEFALNAFFALSKSEDDLGERLRRDGAGRRRKT